MSVNIRQYLYFASRFEEKFAFSVEKSFSRSSALVKKCLPDVIQAQVAGILRGDLLKGKTHNSQTSVVISKSIKSSFNHKFE